MDMLLSTSMTSIFRQVRLTGDVPGLVSLVVLEIQSSQIEI